VNGKQTAVDGTSCSAPIFAGIVALLNNYRIQNRKSPLGFLNPLLYQNPQAFTDIITGSNPYLCCPGFEATTGYDSLRFASIRCSFARWLTINVRLALQMGPRHWPRYARVPEASQRRSEAAVNVPQSVPTLAVPASIGLMQKEALIIQSTR